MPMSRQWIAIIASLVFIIGIAAAVVFVGLRAQQRLQPSGAALPTVGSAPTAPEATATVRIAAVTSRTRLPIAIPTRAVPTAVLAQPIVVLQPSDVTASSNAPPSTDDNRVQTTFFPANAVDGNLETAWRVVGDGIGQSLTLAFATPVHVSSIALVPGYAKVDKLTGTNRFIQNRRVRRARFEFSDGEAVEATFVDQPTLQASSVGDVLTTYIRIVILETSSPGSHDGRNFTPISEVVVKGSPQ